MYTLHIKLACLLVQASVFVEARSLIRTLTIFHQLQIRNVLQHMPQGQCYKTFYGRKLRLFIISQSVCSWQAFPDKSYVRGQVQEPTLEGSNCKVLPLGRFLPYLQTLDQARKTCQEPTLQLIIKVVTYDRKKFDDIGPRK